MSAENADETFYLMLNEAISLVEPKFCDFRIGQRLFEQNRSQCTKKVIPASQRYVFNLCLTITHFCVFYMNAPG